MDWFGLTENEISAVWLTFKVALVSVFLSLPFAIGIAWVLARKSFPGKLVIEGIVNIPLVAPPVVTGYILLMVFGRKGIIGEWFEEVLNIHMAFSFSALVIASSVISFPLAVRTMKASFQMVDKKYNEAARSLGASAISSFFRVTLPLALPGIISGMVLAFARSVGEFGATITFAGNIPGKTQTISTMIYSYIQVPGHESETYKLVIISVILSLLAIMGSEYVQQRKKLLVR